MARTKTLNPKKKFSRDLKIGQVIEIEGKNYVVLVIGAMWGQGIFTRRGEELIGSHDRAVIALHDKPDEYFNLVLHEHADEDAQEDNTMEEWSKFDLSEEQRQRILATPINVTEYGGRTYLQNLLFSVHSHPPEGLGIIYSEVDLERVCDAMHKYLIEQAKLAPNMDASLTIMGMDQVFSEMKAFFSHKA